MQTNLCFIVELHGVVLRYQDCSPHNFPVHTAAVLYSSFHSFVFVSVNQKLRPAARCGLVHTDVTSTRQRQSKSAKTVLFSLCVSETPLHCSCTCTTPAAASSIDSSSSSGCGN
jgi:hypothetical protein